MSGGTIAETGSGTGFQRAGSLRALRESGYLLTDVADQVIALRIVDDQVIAMQGECPHAGGPVGEGEIKPDCSAIICPWHGYEWDLRTGKCDEDPDLMLQRYPVRIEGDDILVKL
jgi:3-phenylpropionate/trans-cinnamate dioxygenase ferredoxin component